MQAICIAWSRAGRCTCAWGLPPAETIEGPGCRGRGSAAATCPTIPQHSTHQTSLSLSRSLALSLSLCVCVCWFMCVFLYIVSKWFGKQGHRCSSVQWPRLPCLHWWCSIHLGGPFSFSFTKRMHFSCDVHFISGSSYHSDWAPRHKGKEKKKTKKDKVGRVAVCMYVVAVLLRPRHPASNGITTFACPWWYSKVSSATAASPCAGSKS